MLFFYKNTGESDLRGLSLMLISRFRMGPAIGKLDKNTEVEIRRFN